MQYITIYDAALNRGAREDEGGLAFEEIQRVGLPPMGGCCDCHATLGAYNAYPTRCGFLRCRDCVESAEDGFRTAADFERFQRHAA